jgi:hypothetical protein
MKKIFKERYKSAKTKRSGEVTTKIWKMENRCMHRSQLRVDS